MCILALHYIQEMGYEPFHVDYISNSHQEEVRHPKYIADWRDKNDQ